MQSFVFDRDGRRRTATVYLLWGCLLLGLGLELGL